eukprot:gene15661-biopygen6698
MHAQCSFGESEADAYASFVKDKDVCPTMEEMWAQSFPCSSSFRRPEGDDMHVPDKVPGPRSTFHAGHLSYTFAANAVQAQLILSEPGMILFHSIQIGIRGIALWPSCLWSAVLKVASLFEKTQCPAHFSEYEERFASEEDKYPMQTLLAAISELQRYSVFRGVNDFVGVCFYGLQRYREALSFLKRQYGDAGDALRNAIGNYVQHSVQPDIDYV